MIRTTNDNPPMYAIIIVLIIVSVAVLFAVHGGRSIGIRETRAEAIKIGVAEYIVIDEHGNTEFRWKTNDDERPTQ